MKTLGDDSKMTYSISNSGSDWTFGVSTSAGSREIKFTLGTEIDTTTLDGRPLKVSNVFFSKDEGEIKNTLGISNN